MDHKITQKVRESLETGFIDKSIRSSDVYQPELLLNKKHPRTKVLTSILSRLNSCEEFCISVAFVTTSGVASLMNTLLELEERGVKGKVVVSQYLNFTQPEALRKLLRFKNIDLRIITKGDSHSKGYIFKYNDSYDLIIGSSNLTAAAFSTNKEWNLKVSALPESAISKKTIEEFDQDFSAADQVSEEFIKNYELVYNSSKVSFSEESSSLESRSITPNKMQERALGELDNLRARGERKGLLISSTGTGKTYLSAFDAKKFAANKLLFIVHRLNIARKSLEAYKDILDEDVSMGIFSGGRKELDKDFIFSTVQTLSKQENLNLFSKTHFDYIVIDESHRSSASTYQRILNHFTPQFLMGMTATPNRTDGMDIFSSFDHNIACEINLKEAMEEEMLCPFHYYGVSDLSIDDQKIDDKTSFNLLLAPERVKRVLEKVTQYGTYNGIPRGLIFCSRNEEAQSLSEQFNINGYQTIALSGKNSEDERSQAIERLESDDLSNKLDYIFTVDIFNEGIDIPNVNQVVMLRPTQSAIIFIQQLGRGLRKVSGKAYLTVIDFIGNYANNYLIPIAIYGNTSYDKDNLRQTLGRDLLPGSSTVNFDRISKEKIYESLNSANLHLFKDLKIDFNLLKFKLGHTPTMMDFVEHGARDPFSFIAYSKSYFNFIKRIDKDICHSFDEKKSKLLEFFSSEINNGKRVEESIILKSLLDEGSISVGNLTKIVSDKYGYRISSDTINSCIDNLNFSFLREKHEKKLKTLQEIYDLDIVNLNSLIIQASNSFLETIVDANFKAHLQDSINYSIYKFDSNYNQSEFIHGFQLYSKYSRKDVFRILNCDVNPVAQNVGGYLADVERGYCPIFVNYHKEDHISESTKYEDEFINEREFKYMSKSNRTLSSNDVKAITGESGDIRLALFIKKSNDEGTEFYYMGDVSPKKELIKQVTIKNDKGKDCPIVSFVFELHHPASSSMYNYLRENIKPEAPRNSNEHDLDERILVEPLKSVNEENSPGRIIPLYNFEAAAGSFSEMQSNKEYDQIYVKNSFFRADKCFACRVVGESMNKVIPNGSVCLFEEYTGGSRNGSIVLAELRNEYDLDFKSAFTVKAYNSHKSKDLFEGWSHDQILLKPNSDDPDYEDIVVDEELAQNIRIIGIFKQVLDESDCETIPTDNDFD